MAQKKEEQAKEMWPKSLRQNILGKVGDAAQRSPLPTYIPNTRKPLAEEILEGSFYEIDHSKLPPRSPVQLHSVRAVMVSTKSELNVTIRYPNAQSLEANLGCLEKIPAVDEKFVMGPELAIQVLGRQIPYEELTKLGHSKSFWLVSCFGTEQCPPPVSVCDDGGASDSKAYKAGSCYSNLQSSRIKSWGSQRVIAYLQDSTNLNSSEEAISQIKVKEEVDKENEVNECKEVIQYVRKRKPGRPSHTISKKMKRGPKAMPVQPKAEIQEYKEGTNVDRWPLKRYEAAAKKLVEVLKANEAVYGNAISRFQLRAEARSQIGDTGLLDHLLKHLAGKVVPAGSERLRRRCDAEGKMEYWLESADLADIRKQAGVQDPYWTPPPGWKSGDCLSAHDCLCCQEVRQLKEDLSNMRRQMAELQPKNEDEKASIAAVPECATSSGRLNSSNLEEMYKSLLKKKSIMEDQLLDVSRALIELEEDMKNLSGKAETAALQKLLMLKCTKSSPGEEMNEIDMIGIEDELGKGAGESNGSEGGQKGKPRDQGRGR